MAPRCRWNTNGTARDASPLPTRLDSSPTERASPTRRASPTPDPTHPTSRAGFIPVSREAHLLLHLPDSLAAHNPPALLTRRPPVSYSQRGSQRIGSGRVVGPGPDREAGGGVAHRSSAEPRHSTHARTHARGRPGRSSRPTGCGRSLCLAFRFYPP